MNVVLMRQFLLLLSMLCCSCSRQVEPESSYEDVFNEHKASMPYYDVNNPKLVILLSGTPGMGKSTLTKELEKYFHAIRISSDESRELMQRHGHNPMRVQEYLQWVLQKLSEASPNHLIIIDSSVDRHYDAYLRFAEANSFDTFIIRMALNRKKVEERIYRRGKSVERLLDRADNHWDEYITFGMHHGYDFRFDNTDDGFQGDQMADLVDAIKNRLR